MKITQAMIDAVRRITGSQDIAHAAIEAVAPLILEEAAKVGDRWAEANQDAAGMAIANAIRALLHP